MTNKPARAEREERYADLLDHHSPQQIDRLFLISLRRRYLYCPVSKVANSSVKAFLYEAEMRACGISRKAADFSTAQVHNLLYGPLIQPFQLPEPLLNEALRAPDFIRFLFVRDPADRLVSCFLDRVRSPRSVPSRIVTTALALSDPQDISFEAFVSVVASQEVKDMNPHWRPIYHEACCDRIAYNRILRFEDFEASLRRLLEELYPRIARTIDLGLNLSPAQTRAKERAAEFVTPQIRARIETIYAKDYEAFGY